MSSEKDNAHTHYDRAERIFLAALDLPAGDRGAFIAERCGHDAQLQGDVRSLLEAHQQPGPFDRMRGELSDWRNELLEEDAAVRADTAL